MIVSCVLSGCITQKIRTTERYAPEFYSADKEFNRVLILPIHMLIHRFEADGKVVPLNGIVAQTASNLRTGLEQQLKEKGYIVVPPDSTGSETSYQIIDPEKAQFEGPSFMLSEKIGLGWQADRNKVQVNDFNFLSAMHHGAIDENVDAYLFIDYFAFHRDPAYHHDWSLIRTFPTWLGIAPGSFNSSRFEDDLMEHGVVRAVLLDAKTGTLLWANSHDFGFARSVHENGTWQRRVNGVDPASVTSRLLQPLASSNAEKLAVASSRFVWQRKLSVDIEVTGYLQNHECGLANLARKALSEKATEQSIFVVQPDAETPHLVLRIDDIREGHFAKADTNVVMTAKLYQNNQLHGNLALKENVDVFQSYDLLCGRLESAFGRSVKPLWSWLEAPTWSPWIK